MLCAYVPTETPGIFQCQMCGQRNTRPRNKSPKRNCRAKRPGAAQHTTPRDALLDAIWQIAQLTDSTADPESELTNCETCRRFTGNGCDRYGGCDGRRRWLQMLANPNERCRKWDTKQGL